MKFLWLILVVASSSAYGGVYYDVQTDSVFRSRTDGSIFKTGKTGEERFVNGLESPTGMRSHNGMLWVATKSAAVGIDLKSGRVRREIKVAGAGKLTDVAVDLAGNVYTADPERGVVWKNSEHFREFPGERPSAVLVLVDKLYVLSNRALYEVNQVNKKSKALFRWRKKVSGGLEIASTGEFLLGDGDSESITYVSRKGKFLGSKSVPGLSGDFSYQYFKDTSQDLLLLPIGEESRVKAVSPKL